MSSKKSRLFSVLAGALIGATVVWAAGRFSGTVPDDSSGVLSASAAAIQTKGRPTWATAELSPEEEDVAVRDAFSRKLDAHAQSPVRAGWSQGAAASFKLDFSEACEGASCTVVASECRWETCVVGVRFSSLIEAARSTAPLVHKASRVNCAVEVVFPDVPVEHAVDAQFLLDCSKLLNGELDERGQPIAHSGPE